MGVLLCVFWFLFFYLFLTFAGDGTKHGIGILSYHLFSRPVVAVELLLALTDILIVVWMTYLCLCLSSCSWGSP